MNRCCSLYRGARRGSCSGERGGLHRVLLAGTRAVRWHRERKSRVRADLWAGAGLSVAVVAQRCVCGAGASVGIASVSSAPSQ